MTERTAYIDKTQARLKQIDAEITRLEARAEEAQADARIAGQQALEHARSKRETVKTRLDQMQSSGEAAWSDIRSGLDAAWDELSSSVRKAADRLH